MVLWAWERPEDLESLDSQKFAVAFLAQTLTLTSDDVGYSPRRQPLRVSPSTKLMAVTRIESQKTTGRRAALSPEQRTRLVSLILKTLELNRVSAIQVDFDATSSEREFYRALLPTCARNCRTKFRFDHPRLHRSAWCIVGSITCPSMKPCPRFSEWVQMDGHQEPLAAVKTSANRFAAKAMSSLWSEPLK